MELLKEVHSVLKSFQTVFVFSLPLSLSFSIFPFILLVPSLIGFFLAFHCCCVCASHHHSLDFYLYFRVWQNSVCRLMYGIGLYLLLGTNEFAGVVIVVGHYHTCLSWGKMWETIASVHSQFLFFSVLLSWLFLFSSSYCCYGLFCLVCNFLPISQFLLRLAQRVIIQRVLDSG
jgi:hypothetical protein